MFTEREITLIIESMELLKENESIVHRDYGLENEANVIIQKLNNVPKAEQLQAAESYPKLSDVRADVDAIVIYINDIIRENRQLVYIQVNATKVINMINKISEHFR